MNENLNDYKERHIRWQNFAITQLGYTSNIVITIGIGFLSFAFDKKFLSTFSTSPDGVFSLKMFLYILSILSILISIGFGIITSISRLYDFKITRHIALTRQRFYNDFENVPQGLPDYDFKTPKWNERITALFRILFTKIELIRKSQTKYILSANNIKKQFNDLRRLANTLGVITWRCLKIQFLFLFISLILYSVDLFI